VKDERSDRVLFLDDDPARAEAFLTDYPQAIWVQTVPDCLSQLADPWDEVHLDHDLGGQTFVDINESDCGMEVIRWLCGQSRDHLRETLFFVHTHNSLAGLLMVLQMRSSGYKAEFRPFGVDPARWLADADEGFPDGEASPAGTQSLRAAPGILRRWMDLVRNVFVGVPPAGGGSVDNSA